MIHLMEKLVLMTLYMVAVQSILASLDSTSLELPEERALQQMHGIQLNHIVVSIVSN